jgi:DNA-directed RNA polymerase sigma subunit (sigma70/sigma32)
VLQYIRQQHLDVDEQYIPKISEALDMSEEKVKEIFDYIMSFNPANQVLTPPYDSELGSEEVSDSFSNLLEMHCGNNQLDTTIELEGLRINLNYVLSQLSEQEQKLLAYKYGFSGETECSYLALEKRMLLEGIPISNGKTAVQSALHHLLSIILETK